ncbi:transposase [Shigella sonnei]|nr:transposase [Shigella sonnei]
MKVVYLAIQAATKKWTMPIRNWKPAMNHGSLAAANRGVAEYELSE